MIRTKCIYDAPSKEDGLRVLVTRYWPRGVKKEKADRWLRDLGPEAGLIKHWKSGGLRWEEFRERYLEEHRKGAEKKSSLAELKEIIRLSKGKPVTLLCTCKAEENCHRVLLKGILEGKVKV